MTVVHHLPAIRKPDPALRDGAAARRFVQLQAAWLTQGLDRADDPVAVGIVLARHEASHERWIGLIAAAAALDPTLALELSSLYAFHGRVAGSIERGGAPLLDREIHVQVRSLLRARLSAMTEDATRRLAAAAGDAEHGAASA